jgi:hypothetical protein
MVCLGLAENSTILKPDLLTEARVARPAAAFASTRHPEYSHLSFIDGADGLLRFLTAHATETSPVGLACLTTVGRHRFGEDWFEVATDRVNGCFPTTGRASYS